jgi:hypothetical protein
MPMGSRPSCPPGTGSTYTLPATTSSAPYWRGTRKRQHQARRASQAVAPSCGGWSAGLQLAARVSGVEGRVHCTNPCMGGMRQCPGDWRPRHTGRLTLLLLLLQLPMQLAKLLCGPCGSKPFPGPPCGITSRRRRAYCRSCSCWWWWWCCCCLPCMGGCHLHQASSLLLYGRLGVTYGGSYRPRYLPSHRRSCSC